jgi:hypothetical protein
MGLARAVSLLGSHPSDYLAGFLQARQGTGGVEQIGRLRGEGWGYPGFPRWLKPTSKRGRAFSEPCLFSLYFDVLRSDLGSPRKREFAARRRARACCVGAATKGDRPRRQKFFAQMRVSPTSIFSPVADACSRLAYCERPRRAFRKAQPWFSSVPAWEVATVSWTLCGDAGRELNPRFSLMRAICRRISLLPWLSAQPSIARNFSGRLPATFRIPFRSVCRRAETSAPRLVAESP